MKWEVFFITKIDYRENSNWTVYVHMNKINGKSYVGVTSKEPEKRWGKNGIHYRGQIFYGAIQKYGWDNFEHIIVSEHLTEDEASDMEKILISKLKSLSNEDGYNISLGGINANASYIGVEVCLFDENYNIIETYNSIIQASEETGQCISSIRRSADRLSFTTGRRLWLYKSQLIDDEIPKSIIEQVDRTYLGRAVCQFKYDKVNSKLIFIKEYDSVSQAATCYNCKNTNITSTILRNGTYKGFIWKYKDEINDIDEFCKNYFPPKIPRPTKSVYRISYTKEYVKYKSVHDACVNTPYSKANGISQCCLHYMPSAFGYIWVYEKDIDDINKYIDSLDLSVLEKHLPVLQFDLQGNLIQEYPSAFEASKTNVDFNNSRILLCCRNKLKTSNGYLWEFKCNVEDIKKYKQKVNLLFPNYTPVVQLDMDNNFIAEYPNIKEASECMKCIDGSIKYVCEGKQKTCRGFRWMYKEAYEKEYGKIDTA